MLILQWHLYTVNLIAEKIAERLGQLNPSQGSAYLKRAHKFRDRFALKLISWKERVKKSGVTYVVTSKHILEVIGTIKEKNIPLIMLENFFDETAAAVEGEEKIKSLDDLYERLVSVVSEAGSGGSK